MTLQEALATLAQREATVAAQERELASRDRQIEELSHAVEASQTTIRNLQHQLEQLLKRVYGPRSEKWDPNQGVFDDVVIRAMEDGGARPTGEDPENSETRDTTSSGKTSRGKGTPHGRMEIPDHLEREEILLDVPEDKKICPVTGEPMVCIGYETSEKIAYRPGRFFVKVYKRPKYVSPQRNNGETGVVTAEMPSHPIMKCKADVGMLAYVAVSKFADHLPLYRQEAISEREGVRIPRSTQDGWLLQVAEAIDPVYEALKEAVLDTEVLFTDDSIIPLIEEGRGKVRQARLWVYVRGGEGSRLVIYDFTEDRRKVRPIEFLGKYQGYVHADAYNGYDELFRREGIVEVGCWSHGRRGFIEAMTSRPRESSEIIARIGQLYGIEEEIRASKPEERLRVRQERSVPVLGRLLERVDAMVPEATPAEPLRKALKYVINQREALRRYTTDGRLEIDNNTAENAIRPLAIGRKNWLFAGSQRGGRAAALYLSLVESCRQNEVDPWRYLNDLFTRVMDCPRRQLRQLLPDRWKTAHSSVPP